MTSAHRTFRPRILTSILALVFIALFVRLGIWQLERADYKASRYEVFVERQQQPARPLADLLATANVEDMLWRTVEATGQFDESQQVLLDNRVINSEVGYFVYTPFRLAASDQAVLVNRGWVPAPASRSELPVLMRVDTTVSISGELKAEPRTGILLAEAEPELVGPGIFRVQHIELDKLQGTLGKTLAPLILRLDAESTYGYGTEWDLPGSDEQKHRGYAFQWFAFAVTLFVIYVVLNIKSKNSNEQ